MKLTEPHLLRTHREIFDISLQLILVSVPLLDQHLRQKGLWSSIKWELGTLLLPKQPSVEQVLKFLNRQGNTTICKPNISTASWKLLEYLLFIQAKRQESSSRGSSFMSTLSLQILTSQTQAYTRSFMKLLSRHQKWKSCPYFRLRMT